MSQFMHFVQQVVQSVSNVLSQGPNAFRAPATSQSLPNDISVRDFAYGPASCCSVDEIGEWSMCLQHEIAMARVSARTRSMPQSEQAGEQAGEQASMYESAQESVHDSVQEGQSEEGSFEYVLGPDHHPGAVVYADEQDSQSRDFAWDQEWAQIFSSTYVGNGAEDAGLNNGYDYLEHLALSDIDRHEVDGCPDPDTLSENKLDEEEEPQGRALYRIVHTSAVLELPPQSFFSSSSDSSSHTSDDSSYDSDGNKIFRLQLPISGTIATRRAMARGEDLKCMKRQQFFQLDFEVQVRDGILMEPNNLFLPIDWNCQGLVRYTDNVSPITGPPIVVATDADGDADMLDSSSSSDDSGDEDVCCHCIQIQAQHPEMELEDIYGTPSPIEQHLERTADEWADLGDEIDLEDDLYDAPSPAFDGQWDKMMAADAPFGGMVEYL